MSEEVKVNLSKENTEVKSQEQEKVVMDRKLFNKDNKKSERLNPELYDDRGLPYEPDWDYVLKYFLLVLKKAIVFIPAGTLIFYLIANPLG